MNVSHIHLVDPGFDLRDGVDFLNGGEGRKALKVLTVKVKAILACICPVFY